MNEQPFPWPWRGAENRRLAVVGVLWLVLLNVWAWAVPFLPGSGATPPWPAEVVARAPSYARLDSGWYLSIIENGYGPPPPAGTESAHAFFPLYPSVARAVHLLSGLDGFTCGLLLSWVSFLLALPLFAEEARLRLGPGGDREATRLLLLYPTAFFFGAVYTESTFFLLALLALREVRGGRALTAAAVGFLAGLTRAPAAAIGPALAAAWVIRGTGIPRGRDVARTALLALSPLLGVLSWVHGVGWALGEPGLFVRVMKAWRHAAGSPIDGPAALLSEFSTTLVSTVPGHPGALVPYAILALLFVLAAVQLSRRRVGDALWLAGAGSLPVLTGTAAGVPRYSLTVVPLTIVLAGLLQGRPRLRAAGLAVSGTLLLYYSARFVSWYFVS